MRSWPSQDLLDTFHQRIRKMLIAVDCPGKCSIAIQGSGRANSANQASDLTAPSLCGRLIPSARFAFGLWLRPDRTQDDRSVCVLDKFARRCETVQARRRAPGVELVSKRAISSPEALRTIAQGWLETQKRSRSSRTSRRRCLSISSLGNRTPTQVLPPAFGLPYVALPQALADDGVTEVVF